MPTTALVVDPTYRARRDRFATERDELTRRWNRVANARLVAFVAAAGVLGWGIWARRPALVGLGLVLLVGFVALAIHHGRLGRRRLRAATLAAINDEALHRLARDWNALPLRHATRAAPDHPFAADLDLFGRASLAHLLDTPATPMGEATLAGWLLDPADPATVGQRQAAVAELAPRLDLRQELELRGRLGVDDRSDPEPFLQWAEGDRWLVHRPWLRWAAWLGPITLALLGAAQLIGLVDRPFWLLVFGANLLLSQTQLRGTYRILSRVATQHYALLGYATQLELLTDADFASPLLRRLQTELTAAGQSAPHLLRRLAQLAALPIPPSSPLSLPLQALTLWDVHVLAATERWQATAGPAARRWLAVLGEAEALAALATLAHDNPGWVFPTLDPAAKALEARDLGHPLLPAAGRVGNDVALGPPGGFLLVTGSNMSGKSTLLRSIGMDVVLAQAGGPVCAAACRLPPLALWTSVRVQDSLEQGVSYFMAELLRLKLVVDAAARRHADDPTVCYLLDEILHGTNTAERQIAARRIVAHLVARGAIGAVSTHDLALADAPELAAAAHPVHFADTVADAVDGPVMTFDYVLKPGVATTTNALRLMRLVGLDLESTGSGPPAAVPVSGSLGSEAGTRGMTEPTGG